MFLSEIVASKTIELELRKHEMPLRYLVDTAKEMPPAMDFAAVFSARGIGIIAEIKKASPSKGLICPDFKPAEIARIYRDNGAAAISVLTEEKYFLGSLEYLKEVKNALSNKSIPVLRKDFILDIYQIYESRAYGADCLLLITAILKPYKLQELLKASHSLNMACLVEVHNEEELQTALQCDARIIGINNRDLVTFEVDVSTTERLRPLIPKNRIVVSESGISNRKDMQKLKRLKVNAALIGEALISSKNIGAKFKELAV